MNDNQTMHAMSLDDTYRVERVLARGEDGITELVTIDGAGPFVRKKIKQGLARRSVWSALADCASSRLPHVEATYELPEHFVVVYDFVPGKTLAACMEKGGPLSPQATISLGIELCEAAEELHRHGIIHRDISPNNIVIAADGAHLIDLGIARMRVEGASKDTTSLGTWGFASPEQYGFAQTDARSDVYSIGRVLGFALTGTRPDNETYEQELNNELVSAPAELSRIIRRACSFEPSARFQSAAEMEEMLVSPVNMGGEGEQNARAGRPVAAGKPTRHLDRARPHRRNHLLLKLALAVAFLGVALAVSAIAFSSFQAAHENEASSVSSQTASAGRVSSNGKAASASAAKHLSAELTVVESGWTADSSGYVHFGIGLKNSSGAAAIAFPTVKVCGYDADGNTIFTDEKIYSAIEPGQTVYFGDQAGNGTAPARVEFKAVKPTGVALADPGEAPAYEISDGNESSGDYGMQTFSAKLKLKSAPSDFDKDQVFLSAILRDRQGKIVAGYNNFTSCPAVGSATPFSIEAYNPPAHATCDFYATQW